ncbi:hypothetical protein AN396_01605 [Candidatus Epulonipiscium fishelsonii]|uniref:Uncharacterized protein n=1 Tax=Candidatus Epulonipiscium fishelsonii TaxID=77094 RepID=A0ACC8XGY9_9FIRM|nr:hypothetical protein AN396_01605 [Epulopiscium sp. SCG-B11WGA-EpuloA1]
MKKEKTFHDKIHLVGRTTSIICILGFSAVGISICQSLDIWPSIPATITATISIFTYALLIGIVEFFVWLPRIGPGATYLSFITGNISNMKIPSMEAVFNIIEVEEGSEKKEVLCIFITAVASLLVIVLLTIIILFSGVFQPILSWPPIQPAFSYVSPAIFGILAYSAFRYRPILSIFTFLGVCIAIYIRLPMAYMAFFGVIIGICLLFINLSIKKILVKRS